MNDPRLDEVLRLLAPPAGTSPWAGGATVLGCLRGVSHEQAAWKPAADRHSVWALTLHVAYWKYAVRRQLQGSEKGAFPRSPANFPALPDAPDAAAWKDDRALLRDEHRQLIEVLRAFDLERLDRPTPGSGKYRYMDLILGIAMHDTYHVGQIQMLKRLYASRVEGSVLHSKS